MDCAQDDALVGTNLSQYCSMIPEVSESPAAGEQYCYPCRDLLGHYCADYDDAVDSCDVTCGASENGVFSGAIATMTAAVLASLVCRSCR